MLVTPPIVRTDHAPLADEMTAREKLLGSAWAAFCWAAASLAITFAATFSSPHGLAAYVVAGIALAAIGAGGEIIRPFLARSGKNTAGNAFLVARMALIYSVLSLEAAALLLERKLIFPHHAFEWLLILYLQVNAGAVSWLLQRFMASRDQI